MEIKSQIYNTYLKYLRYGKPYTLRKNFENLNAEDNVALLRLETFFNKFSHINIDEYFKAYRVIYPEDEHYPNLSYFYTRKAIKTYSLYQKQKWNQNPEDQLEEIRDGFKFLGSFCLQNNIRLTEYLKHKYLYMYSWIQHLKEHRINPYCLMEIGNIWQTFSEYTEEEQELYLKDLIDDFEAYKIRYANSPKTKAFVKGATQKIDFLLNKK
jgi:hypothetical protein